MYKIDQVTPKYINMKCSLLHHILHKQPTAGIWITFKVKFNFPNWDWYRATPEERSTSTRHGWIGERGLEHMAYGLDLQTNNRS
jgi:hypothetical protein